MEDGIENGMENCMKKRMEDRMKHVMENGVREVELKKRMENGDVGDPAYKAT